MALELNPEPGSPEQVVQRMSSIFLDTYKRLQRLGMDFVDTLGISVDDVPEELRPRIPPDVFKIGCDPDWNAYTKKETQVTVDPKKYLRRFAGGHVTLGHPDFKTIPVAHAGELVKLMDYHVGLFTVRFSQPESAERRKTYGKAGCYRHNREKGYVEYRTPDAGWFWAKAYQDVCERLKRAWCEWQGGLRIPATMSTPIRRAIDTADQKMALQLLGEA